MQKSHQTFANSGYLMTFPEYRDLFYGDGINMFS